MVTWQSDLLSLLTNIKFREEIKGNTQRKISSPITNKYWLQKNFTYNNYIPNLTYENKNELYYKSKKIGKNKFNTINSFFEPIVFDNNIFFYDPSGNALEFKAFNDDNQIFAK